MTLKRGQHSKNLTYAFTEHDALMLEKVREKLNEHENQITLIFEYLKQLEQSKQEETDFENRKRIGFKTREDRG
jgi:ADP-dependent phosphofructokinase/glucokinase